MTTFAERLIERMAPWNTGPVIDGSTDLERFLRAKAVPYEAYLALCEEEGSDGEPGYVPAWGKLLDVELCPEKALGWLAMLVGVTLPTGVSENEARELIKAHAGFSRGTLASIEAAIERNLAPGGAFQVIERRNLANEETAYHFVVVIQGSKLNQSWFVTTGDWTEQTGKWESPATDTTGLEAAVNAVKPAGVFWSLIVTEDHPWLEVAGSWVSQTTTWALT